MSTELNVYYDKRKVLKRISIGLVSVSLGLISFYLISWIDLGKDYEFGNHEALLFWWLKITLVFSTIFWGSLRILRTVFRLFATKPQITMDKDGVSLAAFAGWGKLPWKMIDKVSIEDRKSFSSGSIQPCIVFTLSNELAAKNFSKEAAVELQYLAFDQNDLLNYSEKIRQHNVVSSAENTNTAHNTK